ncbi:sensor histidine kinase [Methylocystis heyeri]|uniref:histidine kinase n=1 Tax=Methylocystis heyeri TaxID=391905 RepID=A0A6B8KD38_9HYPH|nr:HAMP domain-containing sensor histidine kinase [Methylocystis heyeri]QGM44955.1 sensor histidine kinase [Methylocystis heyeri]
MTSRLVGYLLIGQILVYVFVWIINIPLTLTGLRADLDMKLDDLGENRIRAQVAESLRRDSHGVPFIRPTRSLALHLQQNPALRFAVFDLSQASAFEGSSPDLVARLNSMGGVKALAMNFTLDGMGDPSLRGALTKEDTSVGRVFIVTYGYRFHVSDFLYFFRDNARDNFIYFLPVFAAAALITAGAARRGLEPLLRAADFAARIDMNSIDQRIPEENIPMEALPLVKAVNEALERLDAGAARQRRFAANAAHEMRTPVAILRARIDALPEIDCIAEVRHDVRRVQTIVDQLLIAARLGENGAPADVSTDVVATARTLVADYAPLVIASRKEIEFVGPSGPLLVRGDPRAIECAMANLLDNAIRAEPSGGVVLVRVEPGVSIEVVDHGAGVPAELREMIFEPFWRGAETAPGTGLGLAIVRETMTALGGNVTVEETPGGGATFRITLPPRAA